MLTMTNERKMKWFAPVVIITEPQSLREQVKKDLEESLEYYQLRSNENEV